MPSLKIKRGTRAQLNAAASAGQLNAGEPYLITDEERLAIGTSATTYQDFSKSGEGGTFNVQTFTSPGTSTWTKPSGVNQVRVLLLGAGAGGNNGSRLATTVQRLGGQGSGGGAFVSYTFYAADLPATVSVTVGAGGNGAAGRTTDGASTAGVAGGRSIFGSYIQAPGGKSGSGQQGAGLYNSAPYFAGTVVRGGEGANPSSAMSPTDIPYPVCTGGGAGGGAAANVTTAQSGGAGGSIDGGSGFPTGNDGSVLTTNYSGGAGGSLNGSAGSTYLTLDHPVGTGGGGGGYQTARVGGNGGDGGIGAGGGAGGASDSGYTSGAGGKGGNGWVRVISW